jgi:hypothetical protein
MLKKILIALAATIDRRRAAALRVAGGADRDDGQRRRRRSSIRSTTFISTGTGTIVTWAGSDKVGEGKMTLTELPERTREDKRRFREAVGRVEHVRVCP